MKQKPAPKSSEPCQQPGCKSHLSHPCEGCGQQHGSAELRQELATHRASPKQLAEKIRLLGSLLDGLNDAQIASELSRYGLAYNEIWELGILVDSALRAARKLRRSSK